jgi:hypothetical protein
MWWGGIEPGGQGEPDGGGATTFWSPELAPASSTAAVQGGRR